MYFPETLDVSVKETTTTTVIPLLQEMLNSKLIGNYIANFKILLSFNKTIMEMNI